MSTICALGASLLLLMSVPPEAPPLRTEFLLSPHWEDGKAEVSRYESTRTVYGRERRFETVMITVKEEIGAESRVKIDPSSSREKPIPGFKLHLFQRFDTENYPYHYGITALVRREDPLELIKQSVSSQEWCGVTYQQVTRRGEEWIYWWDSYFEGEAQGSRVLPLRPVTEEQLLLALRGIAWRQDLEIELPVMWEMPSNRARARGPFPAVVRCEAREPQSSPAGKFDFWRVTARARGEGSKGQAATFWISTVHPYDLVRYEGSLGRTLLLKERRRRAYWLRGGGS
ncbi:MAG: hypothetical protein ACE5GW_10770 [Planctomycetota bacterium]